MNLAERIGSPPDSLAAARLNLADRVAEEIRVDLDAGEPVRVLERIEELAQAQDQRSGVAADPRNRRCLADRAGRRTSRRIWPGAGAARPGGATGCRAGAIVAQQAVAAAKVELENRQKGAAPKIEALYAGLSDGKWPQILAAAEAVLVVVPEHPAARQARTAGLATDRGDRTGRPRRGGPNGMSWPFRPLRRSHRAPTTSRRTWKTRASSG